MVKPATSKSCKTNSGMLWALHIRSTSSRAAVTETPLVDMIAMS